MEDLQAYEILHPAPKKRALSVADLISAPADTIDTLNGYTPEGSEADNFLGLGKGARKKRAIRLDKKAAKVGVLNAKAYAMEKLADKGVQYKSTGASIVGSVAGLVGGIFGGGGTSSAENSGGGYDAGESNPNTQQFRSVNSDSGAAEPSPVDQPEPRKSNTMLYIALALVAIVLVVIIAKKK